MDVLNRAIAQLREAYRSMTPGSRFTAGLLAAVIVGALAYLGTQQGAKPDTDLMRGVPIAESHLPLMEAAFEKAKLKGYVVRGTSIFVPRGDESKYHAALKAANALPPDMGAARRDAMNNVSIMDIGSSREQQRTRFAKLEGLGSFIRTMPGVEDANVEYEVDPKPGPFEKKLATAVVCVKMKGTSQLDESTVLAIRDTVAGAFAGLKPEDVAVADSNGRAWRGPIGTPEENRYRQTKRTAEQELKTGILKALDHIPGADVLVNVEFNREPATAAKPADVAAATAPREEPAPKSPNAASQKPNVAAVLDSLLSGTSGEQSSSPSERSRAAGSGPVEIVAPALTPVSIRVLVRVPMSYFASLWHQRNPEEAGKDRKKPDQAAVDRIRIDESANIQRCVAALLPTIPDKPNVADMVTVTSFEEISASTPAFIFPDDVLNWARQSWKTLAAVGAALICLLGLWLIARSKPAKADVPATPTPVAPVAVQASPPHAKVAAPHWRRPATTAEEPVREELSKLVENDPEAAANILRKWIGQVS
jgi:flagellar M-ring protein FliF